jgi:hypothetical protein
MSEQQWRVDGAERWEWLTFDFEQGAVRVRCGDTFNQSGDDGRTLTREEVIALRDKLSEWIGDDVVANMWCRCGWRVRRVAAFRCSSCGITPLLEEPDGADDPRDVIPLKQQIGAYMKKYGTTEREARRDVDFFRSRMDPEDFELGLVRVTREETTERIVRGGSVVSRTDRINARFRQMKDEGASS